jgi:hypothetical protein
VATPNSDESQNVGRIIHKVSGDVNKRKEHVALAERHGHHIKMKPLINLGFEQQARPVSLSGTSAKRLRG